ncbi:MAG: serine/threonine-protein kinase [Kiritimatiellia bacterium]
MQADQAVGGYRVLGLLGKGGMAEVYEVESEKTGALYALKVFVCEQANAIFLKKRFWSEARVLSRLHHPRIVRVHDFGYADADERTPYYVMDLVLDATGVPCTLRNALDRGLSTEERIAAWYEDLVEALAYIHGKGVVHRDVSLENALVGPDGRAVLSDFGVCKILDRDLRAELDQTVATMMSEGRPLMGKAFYIAPEVRAGRPESPASDIYSLGVLVFYLLNQVWYAPGAKVADLLSLFDERWQTVVPALLEADPAKRRCPRWNGEGVPAAARPEPERRGRRGAHWAGIFLLGGLCAGSFLTYFARDRETRLTKASARVQSAIDAKDANVFCTIPRLDDGALKRSAALVRPFVMAKVVDELGRERLDGNSSAASRMSAAADELESIPDAFDGTSRALGLLCRSASAILFLREGNAEWAVDELALIREECGEWERALSDSLPKLRFVDADLLARIRRAWAQKEAAGREGAR